MTKENKKHIRYILSFLLAALLLLGSGSFAFAEADEEQTEDQYKSSFTEGVSDSLAAVPQKNMAGTIPDQMGKTDDLMVITLLKNRIPNLTLKQIAQMDLTRPSGIIESDLRACTTYPGLRGCEKAFVKAETDYGVNAAFLYGIAVTESSGGANMFKPNNMFGYGQESFTSKAQGIDFVAKHLAEDYLSENGRYYNGKTVADVNKIYCVGNTWHGKVERAMYKLYQDMRAHNLAHYQEQLNDKNSLNNPNLVNYPDSQNGQTDQNNQNNQNDQNSQTDQNGQNTQNDQNSQNGQT